MPRDKETIRLQCQCGTTRMEARGAPFLSVECMCTSCRAAADIIEVLPGARRMRTTNGGTWTAMFRKDRVSCVAGADTLREFRLNETTKTRRVVATCCNTPIFLDFTDGHWIDIYHGAWPEGAMPPIQMRTMTMDMDDATALPDDVPNYRKHSVGFFAHLLGAWAASGFRRPKIEYVQGELDYG